MIKTSTCFKRRYLLLRHIIVQLQILVKVKVIFILYLLGIINLDKKNILLLVLLF